MSGKLKGKKVAILVDNGFEQVELTEPKRALEKAGATPSIVSPQSPTVRGWQMTDWGDEFPVDVPLEKAKADDFDALVLPGGVMNPDHLRTNDHACDFVRAFFDDGKPVAAICHGPWTLIDAGVVRDRKMTSYPSIRTDLENAGARWVDAEVVVDHGLVTSRKPDDLPAFNRKMIEEIAEGAHHVAKAR
jgi:deglycase